GRVGERAELLTGEGGKPGGAGRRVEELVVDVPLGLADPGAVADHGVDVRTGWFVVRHGRLLSQTAARIVRSRAGAEKWTRQNLDSRESSEHPWKPREADSADRARVIPPRSWASASDGGGFFRRGTG